MKRAISAGEWDTIEIGYSDIGYSDKSDIVTVSGWSQFPYTYIFIGYSDKNRILWQWFRTFGKVTVICLEDMSPASRYLGGTVGPELNFGYRDYFCMPKDFGEAIAAFIAASYCPRSVVSLT